MGRTDVLAVIARHLEAGRSVTITGPPGIGASRLLAEVTARHDGPVLRLRGSDAAGDVPLGAAIAALPDLADLRDGSMSELRERARTLLQDRAGDGTLLVAVDDAGMLDPVTAFGVAEVRSAPWAQVVATVRHGSPRSELIERLTADGEGGQLEVPPLADADVVELAEHVLGGVLAPSLADRILTTAAGNPFVVVELLEGARETAAVVEQDGSWHQAAPLPSGRVAALLDLRLASLPPAAVSALERLALAQRLTEGAAFALLGGTPLRALLDAQLVVLDRHPGGRSAALGHPSYRDILLERLPATRRQEHLAALVTYLAPTARTPVERLRVAVWEVELGVGAATDLEPAARLALELGDHELAARIARGAIEQGGGHHAHLTMGIASAAQHRTPEAESHLRAATRLAEIPSQRAAAIAASAQLLALSSGRWEAASSLLADREGTGAAAAGPAELRALDGVLREIRGRGGGSLRRPGGVDGAATTGSPDPPPAHVRYLAAVEAALVGFATLDTARIERARATAATIPATARQVLPLGVAIIEGMQRFAEDSPVDARIDAAVAEARDAPAGPGSETAAWWRFVEGCLRDRAGEISRAAVVLEDAGRVFATVDSARIRPLAAVELALAYASAGATTRATHLVDELEADHGDAPRVAGRCELVRALVRAQLGDPALAIEHAYVAAGDAIADGRLRGALDSAHLATRLGDADRTVAAFERGALPRDGWLPGFVEAHARAVAATDATAMDAVALAAVAAGRRGLAAEVTAQATTFAPDPQRTARAAGLLASCEGLATPPLVGFAPVELGPMVAAAARAAIEGASNQQIAEQLGTAPRTVGGYLRAAYRSLGVGGRRELRHWYRPDLPPLAAGA